MIQEAVLYFVYEGCVTICQCDTCVDTPPDCAEYTKSSCTAPYVNWAYSNCKAYCGFCHTECHNKRSDCHEYGKQVCQLPYVSWAKENCEQYCGFCGHDLKCLYSPWEDLTPCIAVCGLGLKVQVRTFVMVKQGTPLAKDCNESLIKNTTCAKHTCTVPPTAVVKVPVTEPSVVTLKTHVDTGVLDHHGPLIPVDPDTVKDVIKAGTTVVEELAIGALFAELLPMIAFIGKRDVTEQTRALKTL
uniref:ShKT domain-containing protein n=1 Tax=Magallana gigas TaxID=29159 RepID=A0A8W8MCC6_MAGGI